MADELKKNGFTQRRRRLPTGLLLLFLTAVLFLMIVLSAAAGYLNIPLIDVIRILSAKLSGLPALAGQVDELARLVVTDVRLPRILSAAVVGCGLSVAGAVFQGILINPLADPYTLGVSAGAAFGASLALLLNITFLGAWSVPLLAFGGAVATLLAVLYLSTGTGGFSSNNLILAGIIVTAILSAGVSFIKYLADEQVAIIIFWLMGSFASKTWAEVMLVTVSVGIGLVVFICLGRDLNLLSTGRRSAGSLGVHTQRIPLLLLAVASLVASACVAVSGIIGFVGLLVPHMIRFVTGPDNRRLIPAAALGGAVLLMGADTVTRTVLPQEVPIGVITALIGGPVFCLIYRRRQIRKGRW